jgi:hypothetical protein
MYNNELIEYLEIKLNKGSLEKFTQNNNVLYKIGLGKMKFPGHPAGNQQWYMQKPLLQKSVFPTYKRDGEETIFMGYYGIETITKQVSFEGFSYFLFKLHKKNPDLFLKN